jgi:hypothetical protein
LSANYTNETNARSEAGRLVAPFSLFYVVSESIKPQITRIGTDFFNRKINANGIFVYFFFNSSIPLFLNLSQRHPFSPPWGEPEGAH